MKTYMCCISYVFLVNHYVVIIFVIDAINLLCSAFFSYKILPLSKSITIVDFAVSAETVNGRKKRKKVTKKI